jgi:hypothetical protein
MRVFFLIASILLTLTGPMGAQETISLKNPSFEDNPQPGQAPRGWDNIGFDLESPPDIQPGLFNCNLEAYDGKSYVGMVVRDNKTWEAIGQPLRDGLLQKDSVYSFSLFLARSPFYRSISRTTMQPTNYDEAAVLRVWGIHRASGKAELLAETEPVNHTTWEQYEFTLKPLKTDYDEIDLEAYFARDAPLPYNGNLLMDHCSPIVKMATRTGER